MIVHLSSTKIMLAALMAALVFFFVSPLAATQPMQHGWAYAEAPQPTPGHDGTAVMDENGQKIACNEIPEAKGGTLIGRIVPCIIYSIEHTSQKFSQQMIDWLMPTVWAFITFVITMFGLKVLQGEPEVYKHGFLLLLKIGMVVAVLQMIPTVAIPQLYNVMKETQEIVSNTISDANSEIHCNVDDYGDENTLPIWKQLDCVFGKLFGFVKGADGRPSMLLVASAFGMLGGFFFGGTFGVALFVALIGMLWSMFALVLRTVFVFLNSYLYATLMLLIAPLFLPLVLLKVTSSYFDRWWSSILACILLPLIITAYVMFALLVYDKLLFGPNAEIDALFNYDTIKNAQHAPQQACDRPIGNNPTTRSQITGLAESVLYNNPFMQNFSTPTMSAANNLCAGMNLHVLGVREIDPEYKSEKDAFTKLFMHAIKMLVMAMLVNLGFKEVTNYAKMMVGSYSAGSMLDATTLQEQRFRQGLSEARQGLVEGFENKSGAEFVTRIPTAIRSAVGINAQGQVQGGFLGGISRSTD